MNSDAAPSAEPHAPLDEVLDRFDVMIGLCFDRLDLNAVLEAEVGDELAQRGYRTVGQRRKSGQTQRRQSRQPGDLDPQPLAHEGKFRKNVPQLGCLPAVAAVQRRNSG